MIVPLKKCQIIHLNTFNESVHKHLRLRIMSCCGSQTLHVGSFLFKDYKLKLNCLFIFEVHPEGLVVFSCPGEGHSVWDHSVDFWKCPRLQLWPFAAKCSSSQHITLIANGPKSLWICSSGRFWEVVRRGPNLVINSPNDLSFIFPSSSSSSYIAHLSPSWTTDRIVPVPRH